MRFLIDEMFSPDLAASLHILGHEAVHVHELGLAGAADDDVVAHAAGGDLVVVTENAADFIPLLDRRTAASLPVTPVVIAPKGNLPAGAGAMNHALADKQARWAKQHPDPYRHVHWLH